MNFEQNFDETKYEFKVDDGFLIMSPARVYLGEYKLYQNVEPLPRQKFAVVEV